MTTDTSRRAQAEAVVDMLRSATMDYSDPAKQREYEITLAEAALAEHAKAASVSDVGALAERLRERAAEYEATFFYATAELMEQAADALEASLQSGSAGRMVPTIGLDGTPFNFQIGDQVRKTYGYNFPGEIRAAFLTHHGDRRYVVEATGTDYRGMLHIFNEQQLAASPSPDGERQEGETT